MEEQEPIKGEVVSKGYRKFDPSFVDLAYNYTLLGAKDTELANFFSVNPSTIKDWKSRYPEFGEAIVKGKAFADAKVAEALYQRACGYSHEEDKIFIHQGKPVIVKTTKHYPPDPTSALFWLKNRNPENWREKQDVNFNQKVSFAMDFGDKKLKDGS